MEFRVTDDSVNNYGFRVLTSGIDTSAFEKNPICLYNHNRKHLTIGIWSIKKSENEIIGTPEFDEDDEFAMKIAKKVAKGHLRACSIDATVLEVSNDPALYLPGQKIPTVTKCILNEISVVDMPGNSNSIVLRDTKGQVIDMENTESVKLAFGHFTNSISSIDNSNMKQIALALKKGENASEAELVLAITQLNEQNTQLRAANNALTNENKTLKLGDADKLIDAAVTDGRIKLADKPKWQNLFTSSFEDAKSALESIPVSTSLRSIPGGGEKSGQAAVTHQGKTFKELEKENPEELVRLRDSNRQLFSDLYKASYGAEYKF
jgi:cell division protein FtsB